MSHYIRRLLLPTVLVFLLTASPLLPTTPTTAQGEEWPQYRHDSQRSSRTAETIQVDGAGRLHLQWAYSLGERVEIEVEPIVAEGKVFLGAMNGVFSALQSATGALAWEYEAAGPIAHTAAYADGRVFFGSLDGAVYALRASDGGLLWKVPSGGPVYAAPAVANNTVYIGSTGGRFFALDASTGAERWHFPQGGARLATAFTGAAALSPDGTRVYVGNEDLVARALDAQSGALVWQRQLTGTGMRSTHPIVSDDGAVVFFQTMKPGVQSYVPTEDYPGVAPGTDPVGTWNQYYQTYAERRATFLLNAATGADLWNATTRRYVPLPIPNWGMLGPVLDTSGGMLFPTPGGGQGSGFGSYELDHDSRLMRLDLASGITTQIAGRGTFQHRPDENGRATFAGGDYLTTISEDVGAYRLANASTQALFGSAIHYFSSHMDPLAPLPSKHLWRYGGTISLGGVLGASPPVVAGGVVYYISYGWLFALSATDRGKDPVNDRPLAFTARDARLHPLTYPRSDAPNPEAIRDEIERRVADIVSASPLPPTAKFDQAGGPMLGDISTLQIFGMPAEQIRVLAAALPFVSPALQTQLRATLKSLAERELFNPDQHSFRGDCLVYGRSGIQNGSICNDSKQIVARWYTDNELLVGERLYAMAVYAEATGDWDSINARWSFIQGLFSEFVTSYDPARGICKFEGWHVGKLGLASQISAAAGVLRMAEHRGDRTAAGQARTLLENLLATRVRLARFAQTQYDAGVFTALPIRIAPDGVPNDEDISQINDGGELIPLSGDRTRATDTRQVNQYDGEAEMHSGAGFMYYPALIGFSPLSDELIARLKRDLLPETRQYVQSYEVNAPWWWMNDLAHHTTAGGEHIWHSPTLAYDLFQVKARVLEEDWDTLRRQLPQPMSINSRYDFQRLHNLVTLMERSQPVISDLTVTPKAPAQGARVQVTLLFGSNAPLTGTVVATLTLPPELAPIQASASATHGSVSLSGGTLTWSGELSEVRQVTVTLEGVVSTADSRVVAVSARINAGEAGVVERSARLFLNGRSLWMPVVRR